MIKLIELQKRFDDRGSLSFLEGGKDIPFEIKRIYYLYHLNQAHRGFHAHKKLNQVAICVSGSCTFVLDDGRERQEVRLTKPNEGLFIDKMIWREMKDFSSDAVLLVLASEHYDESDYIRNYDEFLRLV
jgi:dTDP-4-dehydrorhamnose 3,5-epimerase-like enzyme